STDDADFLSQKISQLRVFEDQEGKMNLSVSDLDASVLVVSQFTLYGDCRKGRRPSFDQAAPPAQAEQLYEYFVDRFRGFKIPVQTGVFRAMMKVSLTNDGPVTFVLDS
ncbi:MAG: D-tyrosyl-tRNA(Tyr) deacylase, partial [Candidatus Omnitrophica bacterium]|nr:D-tyrosyl-tRNA(Tyr) deacylase [Candidatus Omnitrophota bacterium]